VTGLEVITHTRASFRSLEIKAQSLSSIYGPGEQPKKLTSLLAPANEGVYGVFALRHDFGPRAI
jgi:hypothetical protein